MAPSTARPEGDRNNGDGLCAGTSAARAAFGGRGALPQATLDVRQVPSEPCQAIDGASGKILRAPHRGLVLRAFCGFEITLDKQFREPDPIVRDASVQPGAGS